MAEPAPSVVVTALNDYNNAIQLRVWLADEREHIKARFELREKVFKAFSSGGIDMPFETFALAPLEVTARTPETSAAA
jgi:small conductance mechanosensitive channel